MATLSHIAVYPVDVLDPVSVDELSFSDRGRPAADRTYTVVDADGDPVDGTRTAAVHALRSTVDLESGHIVLRVDEQAFEGDLSGEPLEPGRFHLADDRDEIADWLSRYFGTEVRLRRATDESGPHGPRLVARATLREAASWFDLTTAEMRMRVRPNLVVAGVPPFWEDQLVGATSQRIEIGDVTLDSGSLVELSAAVSRDPYTGTALPSFRETFETRRRETLPEWSESAFDDDYYRLSVRLSVPESERGGVLAVGDEVELLDDGP